MKQIKFETVSANEVIRGLIKTRDQRIHVSAVMLLSIVDRLTTQKKGSDLAYIGECEAMYRTYRVNSKDAMNYTYSGIATMLRNMAKRDLLVRRQDGQYVGYYVSRDGLRILDELTM